MEPDERPRVTYRRILLKLSGEALLGVQEYGIDPDVVNSIAREIVTVQQWGG